MKSKYTNVLRMMEVLLSLLLFLRYKWVLLQPGSCLPLVVFLSTFCCHQLLVNTLALNQQLLLQGAAVAPARTINTFWPVGSHGPRAPQHRRLRAFSAFNCSDFGFKQQFRHKCKIGLERNKVVLTVYNVSNSHVSASFYCPSLDFRKTPRV